MSQSLYFFPTKEIYNILCLLVCFEVGFAKFLDGIFVLPVVDSSQTALSLKKQKGFPAAYHANSYSERSHGRRGVVTMLDNSNLNNNIFKAVGASEQLCIFTPSHNCI